MRSRAERLRRLLGSAALLAAPLLAGGASVAEPAAGAASAPGLAASAAAPVTPERVRGIVDAMRSEAGVSGKHIERRLRWKRSDAPAPAAGAPPWVVELVRWLADAGRGLMWLLGAIAVALIAVFAWRWASVKADAVRARAALRPSHVNDLDIRPESLPDDIAGAARALWQRGEHRAALSLLYRGALSRLVHGHGVPIRAASTEGECLRLAQRALAPAGSAFFEQLVRAWQIEVYAGRGADASSVAALCAQFDAHFAPAAAAQPAGAAA